MDIMSIIIELKILLDINPDNLSDDQVDRIGELAADIRKIRMDL